MRLAADTTGEGPAVLLVHGFPDSRAVWRHQVGPLAEAGFRVIAPDLRGFGASERPEGVEPTARRAHRRPARAARRARHRPRARRRPRLGRRHRLGARGPAPGPRPSLAALSVGHPNAVPAAQPRVREKAWYQLLFQFEEAEELLLRDDARLLREWLADAPDADRYVEELREPGALTARLGLYRANLHPRGELEPPRRCRR